MQTINNLKIESHTKSKETIKNALIAFVVAPLQKGFLGFALFAMIIASLKWFGLWAGVNSAFYFNTDDLAIFGVGFVFFFLIRFLENFNKQ